MDKKNQKYMIILMMLVLGIAVSLLFFLLKLRKIAEDRVDSEPVIDENLVERAALLDRNGYVLAMDMPENALCFDKRAQVSDSSALSDFFARNFSVEKLRELQKASASDGDLVVIERNVEAFRRSKLESDIESCGFSDFLFFQDTVKRVYSDNSPFFRTFIGGIDNKSREGVFGMEKYCNAFLADGDVNLTLDESLCKSFEDIFKYASSVVHIVVIDRRDCSLVGLYDNDYVTNTGGILNFPDISESDIFNSKFIVGMLEKDMTRLEEYYCNGIGLCREKHGVVNLRNIIRCPSAISNLMNNNYSVEELGDYVAQLQPKHGSDSLVDLVNLAFVAYNGTPASPVRYVLEEEANPEPPLSLADNSLEFLRDALDRQCDDISVFVAGDDYLAIMYQAGGIDQTLKEKVRVAVSAI